MKMTLSQYIQLHGDAECAARWGMTPRAVAAWRRGERQPETEKAKEIIRESGGCISWDAIYGSPYAAPAA